MDLKARFSPQERLKFVQERFKAGVVLKLFCNFTADKKHKRLLIVASNRERPLFFFINTDKTEFAKSKPHLDEQNLLLIAAEENFLDHDSYLDCSVAFDNFDRKEVEAILCQDTTLILGDLSPEAAEKMLEIVTDSATLSRVQINEISMEIAALLN